jgi:serine protease Do
MRRFFLIFACLVLGGLSTYIGQSLLQGQASSSGAAAGPRDLSSYRDIVKKVLPAVVSIDAQARGADRGRRGEEMRFPSDPDNPGRVGFGSGFNMSPKGVIVTNNHVVEGADHVIVQWSNGKKHVSRTIRTDSKTDLAIIQLDSKEPLAYLDFGNSEVMEIGDRVLAVGAPFGLSGTVTQGIISSKGRALRMNVYEDFLQTDAAINPGNSGGPLINLEGKVIGINSAIKSRSGGFQGIGLAISSTLGKSIVEQLLKEGVVRRGYLGVGILDVDEEIVRELNLKDTAGVKITRVQADAPGEKAGLKRDDVIVRIAGKPIKDGRGLQMVVAGLPVGKAVDVVIIRQGKSQTKKVTIEEQPQSFSGRATGPEIPRPGKGAIVLDKVGLVVADLTPELAESLGYPESVRGALITQVTRKGLAYQAGLKPGMVILKVDGKTVSTARALATAIADGSTRKGIVLQVRGPRTSSENVTLKEEE